MTVGVLANGAAVALTVAVLPGLAENTDRPVLGYLALGALLGILNAIVKPVLQFFALPLLVDTFGLVVIAVDTVVVWLLDVLTPTLLTADGFLPIIGAGILIGLLSFIIDNVLGLTPPIVDTRATTAA